MELIEADVSFDSWDNNDVYKLVGCITVVDGLDEKTAVFSFQENEKHIIKELLSNMPHELGVVEYESCNFSTGELVITQRQLSRVEFLQHVASCWLDVDNKLIYEQANNICVNDYALALYQRIQEVSPDKIERLI